MIETREAQQPLGYASAAEIVGGVGDYRCACGQSYRLYVTAERIRAWPESGVGSFSGTQVAGTTCIRCAAPLPVR
jgi:hypothetical protein